MPRGIFDDSDDEGHGESSSSSNGFRVNRKFADRYMSTKRRQELEGHKARALLRGDGNGDGGSGSSSSSSSEEEDSDAEELTPQVEVDILKTIQMIRRKDPQIYDKNKQFFSSPASSSSSAAFAKPGDGSTDKNKSDKAVYFKDYMRGRLQEAVERGYASEEGSDAEDAQDERRQREQAAAPSYHEEQAELKRAFLRNASASGNAADPANSGDGDDDDGLGGGLLKVREKSAEELAREEREASDLRKQLAEKLPSNEREALRGYFEQEPEDEAEKFLRDYVLNREWADHDEGGAVPRAPTMDGGIDRHTKKNNGNNNNNKKKKRRGGGGGDSDSEGDDAQVQQDPSSDDEDVLDAVDRFERAYNFRFEEPQNNGSAATRQYGGSTSAAAHITTYSRAVEGSLRRKDDRRKLKRDERKRRKEEERRAKQEELKRLKNLKRQEIEARLREIEEATGTKGLLARAGLTSADLDGDFDMAAFDAKMQAAFNDDFYEEEEEEEEGVRSAADAGTASGAAAGGQGEGEGTAYPPFATGEDAAELPAEAEAAVREAEREMNKLDYEGMVGGMQTRFKYRQVEATSFGLTAEEILTADDSALAQLVSVKKLAPYREQEWYVSGRARQQFRKSWRQQRQRELESGGVQDDAERRKRRRRGGDEDGRAEEIETVTWGQGEDEDERQGDGSSSSSSSGAAADALAEEVPKKKKKKRVRKKQAMRAAKLAAAAAEAEGTAARAPDVAPAASAVLHKPQENQNQLPKTEDAPVLSSEAHAAQADAVAKKAAKKERKRARKRKAQEEEEARQRKQNGGGSGGVSMNRLASYGVDVVKATKKERKRRRKAERATN